VKTLERLRQRVADVTACRDVGRVLQSYLDGELDAAHTAEVATHLEHCVRCGMEADVYTRIQRALARRADGADPHPENRLAIERLRRFATTLNAPEDSP